MLQESRRGKQLGSYPRPSITREAYTPWMQSVRLYMSLTDGCRQPNDHRRERINQRVHEARSLESASVRSDAAVPSQMRSTMPSSSGSRHLNSGQRAEE